MTYFLMHKFESKENLMYSSNILGEESLGTFYPEQGWVALHNMMNNHAEMLENYIILDEKGKKKPVLPLRLETDEERRRYSEGELRRKHRLERKHMFC